MARDPRRIRDVYSFPIDDDLAMALNRLREATGVPAAVVIRRALRRELEDLGVLPKQKTGRKRAATRKRP